MPRTKRADEAGAIYHMLNRANRRATIFHKQADFEALEHILTEALERVKLKLFAYCILPNHWHLVVSPEVDGEMGRFGQWLGLTHTQRYNAHYGTTGEGHLYQGRYKSFPVQGDEHFLSLCRYVERNAFSAELCAAPDQWRFGSLYRWAHGSAAEKSMLSPWPIPRRPNWIKWVTSAVERQGAAAARLEPQAGRSVWRRKLGRSDDPTLRLGINAATDGSSKKVGPTNVKSRLLYGTSILSEANGTFHELYDFAVVATGDCLDGGVNDVFELSDFAAPSTVGKLFRGMGKHQARSVECQLYNSVFELPVVALFKPQ